MAFYQSTKTAKAAAIGTIMPWTGGLSQIPDGWILCNGGTVSASQYPLLAKSIGDSYNSGGVDDEGNPITSTFAGSFPNYTGEITIPNLNAKNLIDIESSYFGAGGTGNAADLDSVAASLIQPLIGTHSDNGVEVIINDARTDVVFELNDTTGYSGKIAGNTREDGSGSKTVYVGPRKLGRDHVRGHRHSGSYETIGGIKSEYPGLGVIPWSNIEYKFDADNSVIPGDSEDEWVLTFELTKAGDNRGADGFNSGIPGRIVAGVEGEAPPVNATPKKVTHTPITENFIANERFDGGDVLSNIGLFGENITIPAGEKNYYDDGPTPEKNYGTFLSNTGVDFTVTQSDGGVDAQIFAHSHGSFEVEFDNGSLQPQNSLNIPVTAPTTNVLLDNSSNVGVLQVNFNTTQPSVTCVYIIRAY